MTENDFLHLVEKTIDKFRMADKSDSLLVGLSGGADSVALLLSLCKLGYKVKAVHVNHCLRGEESDRDENFCINLCEKLNIPLIVKKINVINFCEQNHISTEEGARILRYRIFDEQQCDRICTAHNLNDCLETTLFNLARGTGLKGIASIPPVRGRIIRPLIETGRQEIENFLKKCGQNFVTDSTNLQEEYSRNKIRHKVIPALEQINSSLMKTFSCSLDNLRTDSEFLEKTAVEEFEKSRHEGYYDSSYIIGLDKAVERRVIINILAENSIEVSAAKILQVEELMKSCGKVNISEEIYVICKNGRLEFLHDTECKKEDILSPVKIETGEVFWGKRKIIFSLQKNYKYNENVHKKFANCCFDYDKIKGEIFLRQRKEGDKIRLVNREFHSDVRKLINKSFVLNERNDAVIISDDDGVIFVEKNGAADRVKIDEKTKNILVFSIVN